MEVTELMRLALSLSKRAESYDQTHLAASFVGIGHIPTLLKNNDSAIIYGRRGTGKTHLLSYLSDHLQNTGIVSVSVDMRTIGSSTGIYADPSISLPERATRLLRDTANSIHEKILEKYTAPSNDHFGGDIIPALDALLDAANSIQITGVVTQERVNQRGAENTDNGALSLTAGSNLSFNANLQAQHKDHLSQTEKIIEHGSEQLRINFGSLTTALERLVGNLPNNRLWILLDEWSEVPTILQPYLADILRRGFFPVRGVTTKIAAIEHRSSFRKVHGADFQSIGIEIGADVAMSINLDDHMVFDNDSSESNRFFSDMLFSHMKSIANNEKTTFDILTADDLVRQMFTQTNCFNEFVRAAEGVPRDAINILSKCALKSKSEKISMQGVRASAKAWYSASKYGDISSRQKAVSLLDWITSEVIGSRRARGFLLDSGAKDDLIDFLFDSRVLHVIKRNISSKDREDSGRKFNAWAIDYGCYCDLFNTESAPRGLFEVEEVEATSQQKYVEVPQTDYRSLRRAVLDLEAFYSDYAVKVAK